MLEFPHTIIWHAVVCKNYLTKTKKLANTLWVIQICKVLLMTNDDIDIISRDVKDMYGTFVGKIIGTVTDIDGSVQFVGVDCGFQGLMQIPYEQLIVRPDAIIFFPKWRLDSQKLLREKRLTLRRLKALNDIVADNDDMKEDAQIIYPKYKSRLDALNETEHIIKAKLDTRMEELEEQVKAAKTLLFDAKMQFRGDEISDRAFDAVKMGVSELLEHREHEIKELQNVRKRLADLDAEAQEITEPVQSLQESAVSYMTSKSVRDMLPEVPTEIPASAPVPEASSLPTVPTFDKSDNSQNIEPTSQPAEKKSKEGSDDWLSRMQAQ